MAYQIPSRRAMNKNKNKDKDKEEQVDHFPALCSATVKAPVLDFTQLSFEDEIVPVPERRFEPGWLRLSFKEGKVLMETDYVAPEPSLDALANKAILRMKSRWVKFYTDKGLESYNYDYMPHEPVEVYSSEEEESIGEDEDLNDDSE